MHALSYLNKYLFKYRYHFLFTIFLIVGNHIFSIIPARLIKYIFDCISITLDWHGVYPKDQETIASVYQTLFKKIHFYIEMIMLMAVLKFVCAFFLRQILRNIASKIEYELKNEIYSHYQTLSPTFYHTINTGRLMSLITDDVARVKLYLGPAIFFTLNAVVLFVILIPYMLFINAKLTFYAILTIPILSFIVYYVKEPLYKRSERLQERLATLTTQAQETFAGIQVIQAFTREESFINHFSQEAEKCKQAATDLTAINALANPIAMGANTLGIVLIVWIGGKGVIKGELSIGNIAEFVMYMHLITWPILTISLISNHIQRAAASQKRINQLLAEQNPILSLKNLNPPIQGSIIFHSVTFTYPGTGAAALKDVSFKVNAGKSVLILGMTGSGKSTMGYLLTRFYDPQLGEILIDDLSIKTYKVDYLRDQIGYVPQDILLFPDTIRNNIIFGKKNATKAEIEQAVEKAGLYTTLEQLPKHLDTVVGERDTTLSGGQKQRIALARAFIRNPKLLILDNPFSALDAHTEKTILNNLKNITAGRTTFIISSKILPPHLIDNIIVLDNGRMVEEGTHTTLLAAKGFYYQSYSQPHP